MSEPFALDFSCKSVQETTHDGQDGLLLTGYATRFGEVDQSGEHMTKQALRDLDDCWGSAPIVLYEHGLSDLGTRRIGQAIDHHIDEDGLRVSVFVPKEPGWKDQRAVRAFKDVYERIKRGVLRGFSVGGTYTRDAAGAIKRWSMLELSVVSKPCLPSATFAVGAKAVSEAYGALPSILDDDERRPTTAELAGSDPGFTGDMTTQHYLRSIRGEPSGEGGGPPGASQTQSVADGSVVPLNVPAGNVTVSAPVAALHGGWTLSYAGGGNVGWGQLDVGAKATTKREPDGADHPPSHYLVVEDENKASTFHLQVKNAQGDYDRKLCAQAYAALRSNFRGNPYQGPDKQGALQKLRAIYKSQGWDWPADEEKRSGKKGAVLRDGVAFLRDFEHRQKAGRQHSAATLAKVKQVIDLLEQHFGLADDQDEEQAEEESAALVS